MSSAESSGASQVPKVAAPLSMAVHSLPDAGDPAALSAPASGRAKMLAMVLLCSLPVIASYAYYIWAQPRGSAKLGELIQPVRPLVAQTVRSAAGQAVALESLRGQWLLVSVGTADCPQDCPQRLFLQRQLRELVGKDKDRIDRVWLVVDDAPIAPPIEPLLREATVLRVSADLPLHWLGAASLQEATRYLYVVDPRGNAMMRLPAQFDAKAASRARRDLDRLLRGSAGWDWPGR